MDQHSSRSLPFLYLIPFLFARGCLSFYLASLLSHVRSFLCFDLHANHRDYPARLNQMIPMLLSACKFLLAPLRVKSQLAGSLLHRQLLLTIGFPIDTKSRLLYNSEHIEFTKIRCQNRPPQFRSMKIHASKHCKSNV